MHVARSLDKENFLEGFNLTLEAIDKGTPRIASENFIQIGSKY